MRKRFLLFFTALMIVSQLFAADIDTVIEKAKAHSSKYRDIELSYANKIYSFNQRNLVSNGAELVIDMGQSTVLEGTTFYAPTFSMNVIFPEIAEGLKISANASVTGKAGKTNISFDNGASYNLGAKLDYSKTFDYNKAEPADISDLQTSLQTEANYHRDLIQFESTLIRDVISIMQSERQLDSLKKTYEKALRNYESAKYLGDIAEGSITEMNQQMSIEKQRIGIEAQELRLNNQLIKFEHDYGIGFEEVESCDEPDLSFERSGSNTTVYLAYLAMLSAKNKVEQELGNVSKLVVSGSIVPSVNFTDGANRTNVSANASAKYTSGKISLSGTVSSKMTDGSWESPKLTISGSWGKKESDSYSLNNLEYEFEKAQNTYEDALYSYNLSADSLETSIENHVTEVLQLEVQTEYHKRILEAKQQLYSLGLCTWQEVETAQSDFDADLFQKTVNALQARVDIVNQIKILEL